MKSENKWFDLVVVQGKYFGMKDLYRAPACSGIKKGDIVTFEAYDDSYKEQEVGVAITHAYLTCEGEKEYHLLMDISDAEEPLPRITGLLKEIEYEEGDDK